MKKEKMPMYGVGPLYVITIAVLTIIGITLSLLGYLDSGKFKFLEIPFFILGLILIIYGVTIWILAVIFSKIGKAIEKNALVTTGIYAWVRNPIYSAFLFLFTGLCFLFNNLWLLILPIIFYLFLTLLMINTEEKWLKETFGDEYIKYCKNVNRCLPWFPKDILRKQK